MCGLVVSFKLFFKVGGGGVKLFLNCKWNNELYLIAIERGGRHFFKVQ